MRLEKNDCDDYEEEKVPPDWTHCGFKEEGRSGFEAKACGKESGAAIPRVCPLPREKTPIEIRLPCSLAKWQV